MYYHLSCYRGIAGAMPSCMILVDALELLPDG
jgi:hypothetical protein